VVPLSFAAARPIADPDPPFPDLRRHDRLAMSQPLRLALLGFSRTERAAFEAFFRLAHKRKPAYERVRDVAQAQLVLLDADDETQFARATELGLAERCVVVGSRALPGAALQMRRPLNVLRLISRIDRLFEPAPVAAAPSAPAASAVQAAPAASAPKAKNAAPDHAAAPAPATPPASAPAEDFPPTMPAPLTTTAAPPSASRKVAAPIPAEEDIPPTVPMPLSAEMAPTQPMGLDELPAAAPRARPRRAGPVPAVEPVTPVMAPPMMPAHERISLVGLDEPAPDTPAGGRADLIELPAPPAARPRRSRLKHLLVAGGNEDMLRWLVAELEPFGFALHLVRDAAASLDSVRRHRCDFVLVEAGLGGHGAAALAGQLRLAALDRGWAAPAVILFGAREALVRAFARVPQGSTQVEGALTLPLGRAELLDLLGGRTLQQQTFAPTAPQTADV
jgi:hypothetical protein